LIFGRAPVKVEPVEKVESSAGGALQMHPCAHKVLVPVTLDATYAGTGGGGDPGQINNHTALHRWFMSLSCL